MKSQSSGFTLVELVAVIVVLGILAATALPKFVDVSSDARISVLNGVASSMRSSGTMVFAKSAIEGEQRLGNASVAITGITGGGTGGEVRTRFGYPTTADIVSTLDLDGGATSFTTTNGRVQIQANCRVDYVQSAAVGAPPAVTVTDTGC